MLPIPPTPDIDDLLQGLAESRATLQQQLSLARSARVELAESCARLKQTLHRIKGTGEFFATPAAERLANPDARVEALSPRERQVLLLIAEGNSTRQIAQELGITFKTAVTHRTNLLKKLDAHESTTLVRIAIRAGMVAP